jgi:hypothetical protein
MISRRGFLAAPCAQAALPVSSAPGQLRTRTSLEVKASPFSVGMETLDRQLFDPERVYPHLARLGVKWARVQTGWNRCETVKGVYDFRWLDKIVDTLLAAGIQPWFSLGFGNALYTPGAEQHKGVGWVPLNSPEARQAWQRFTAAVAGHFRQRVRHWEIWNEPNGKTFWRPTEKPDPAGYIELVKMSAAPIRRAIRDAVLVGGGFMEFPHGIEYVDRCMEAGLGALVDRISYHGYRARPEWNYERDVRAFEAFLKRYNPRLKAWNGENGAPSMNNGVGGLSNYEWSEATQARWLLRRCLQDFGLGLELTCYFHASDMPDYGRITYGWPASKGDTTNSKGLIRGRDYSPKPSYYAYQNLCALFDADTSPGDWLARYDQPGPGVDEMAVCSAVYTRKGRPMYCYWFPSNLQKPYGTSTIRLQAWSGRSTRIENPVLVDLLTGEVARPERAVRARDYWRFDALRLEDYPLVVTDASALA